MPATIDVVGPLNMGGLEIQNARIQSLSTPPTNVPGRIYFDSALGQLGIGNGTTWTYLSTTAGLTQEQVEDIAAAMFSTSSVVTATYDDPSGKITLTIGTGQITNGMVSASAAISADKLADGTTNKLLTATERSKLAGIASGATANSPDATLLARANHTGTQASATISDFAAAVDARIAVLTTGAPAALDTLDELAAALGDDPNFAATITGLLANKVESYSTTVGDGTATTFVITHNLNTRKVRVTCAETGSPYAEKLVPNERTSLNTVTVYFATPPTAGQFDITVHGKKNA